MVQRQVTMPIRFHGDRGGRHRLTWGQRDVYRAFRLHSPHNTFFNLRIELPLHPGIAIGHVVRALRWAVQTHESLRTTYPVDEVGAPYQLVHHDGTITLHVVDDVLGDYRPGRPLEHLGREFDHGAEFPLRCVLVTANGDPAWLALEVSHVSADTVGIQILRRALTGRLAPVVSATPERPASQAADRAAEESTPAAAALARRATAYLRRTFEEHPVPVFAAPELDGEVNGRPRALLTSPALGASVTWLARHHRVTSGTVYLTLIAQMVRALSGRSRFAFSTVSANRWVPGADNYVGTLNQYAVIAADLTGADLPTALHRIQAAGLKAFEHALYNLDDLASAGVLAALDRVDCAVNNNQRQDARPEVVPMEALPSLRMLTELSDLPPFGATPPPFQRSLQLTIGGTAPRPALSLCVDRRVLPTLDLRGALLAIEEAAVRATDPAGALVSPIPSQPGGLTW